MTTLRNKKSSLRNKKSSKDKGQLSLKIERLVHGLFAREENALWLPCPKNERHELTKQIKAHFGKLNLGLIIKIFPDPRGGLCVFKLKE